ncbi:SGNH/GDSL hydrolase family protein [Tundrisphaera sp. TA3]|uniref:SGNH/GDSL hydrolase family protein n=1 Tax=Tundrisphaera sp. TA3 TaxID=3435775 RepID=UPI003EB7E332
MNDRRPPQPSPARVVVALAVLALGVIPLPAGWAVSVRDDARSLGLNRADRAENAGGYYEGLIGGAGANRRGARSALDSSLIGRAIAWNRVQAADITRGLDGDFLQFDLKPDQDKVVFGERFTTNSRGLRDREYAIEKPEGTFRIALLGSSIDMGWGVATDETYENRLEDWLNAEAARRGLARRFEVLNFAIAAYGPAQRYEAFHRKALEYQPDLVLFSATMLDPRLVEIHLGALVRNGVDLKYPFFIRAAADAGITTGPARGDAWADRDKRNGFKARIKDHYWTFADGFVGAIAADCRSLDIPLAYLLVPRACRDDVVDARALAAARHAGIAARHAVPFFDLSASFDDVPSASVEIAPNDDHPNTLGHRLLFENLSRSVMDRPALAGLLFPGAG